MQWLAILFVVALVSFSTGPAGAGVHDGGVGSCGHCHIMHQGEVGGPGPGSGANSLLIEGSASDLCLNCHASSYGEVLGGNAQAPTPERGPGNFVFLFSANLNDGPDGLISPISGDAAGHNINAPGHNLSSDGTYQTSPGGTFPSSRLKCTSCHDPHGNSNYRFLRGPEQPGGGGGRFLYPAPQATGLPLEFGAPESKGNHIAYRGGMSLWCGNCHEGYLDGHNYLNGSWEHPTDEPLTDAQVNQYNIYNGTADPIGGLVSTAYLPAVPFEDASMTPSTTSGPTTAARINCLSCHRAHASSAPHAGRWDFNVATLGDDGVISGSYPIPNPYNDPGQLSLCYKCHQSGTVSTTNPAGSDFQY